MNAADENRAREQSDKHAAHDRRNTERVVHGGGNRVRLHHAADKADGDNNNDREDTGEYFGVCSADVALQAARDVKCRTADKFAGDFHAILLRQNRFGENGTHAEERRQPHPENGAGTARHDGGRNARDVTGADLRGNRDGQRLERGDGFSVAIGMLIFIQFTEDLTHRRSEADKLRRAEIYRKK